MTVALLIVALLGWISTAVLVRAVLRMKPTADEVHSEIHVEPQKPLTPPLKAVIMRVVAERYGLTPADLLVADKTQPAATARQLAMRLMREMGNYSYPDIGRVFNRDHTTVMHACRVTESMAVGDIRDDIEGAMG
jgi:chromosomal replication initiation ATPase DnaA